ncbi:hypothetical protein ACHQM5_011482 [Ranunculus cassubicifolius]
MSTKRGAFMESVGAAEQKTPFSCLKIAKQCSTTAAKDENFVFSPYSIQLGLSLLTNGSSGLTKTELLNFLEAENMDDLNSLSEKVLDTLCKSQNGDPVLSLLFGVWIDESLTIKTPFKDTVAKVYRAKAETIDFQDEAKSKDAIQKVNRWAEEATNGLIKSVLPEDDFDPCRRIILANVLYFKGRWCNEFDPSITKERKFYLHGGNSVEAPFMCSGKDQNIATFEDFKILRLPYERKTWQKSMSMYILLPNERDGLWSLIDMVASDPLFIEKYISPMIAKVRVGEFMVPKFKIGYGFDAKEVLEAVGMKLPFSGNAELDEMAHGSNTLVSKVIQKSYIDVNEEGTEAAAVTIVLHAMCSPGPPKRPKDQVDFVADHPFIFMVRSNLSGAVLFMGHVVNQGLKNRQISRYIAIKTVFPAIRYDI